MHSISGCRVKSLTKHTTGRWAQRSLHTQGVQCLLEQEKDLSSVSLSSGPHNLEVPAKDTGAVGTDVRLVTMSFKSLHFEPYCFVIICFA